MTNFLVNILIYLEKSKKSVRNRYLWRGLIISLFRQSMKLLHIMFCLKLTSSTYIASQEHFQCESNSHQATIKCTMLLLDRHTVQFQDRPIVQFQDRPTINWLINFCNLKESIIVHLHESTKLSKLEMCLGSYFNGSHNEGLQLIMLLQNARKIWQLQLLVPLLLCEICKISVSGTGMSIMPSLIVWLDCVMWVFISLLLLYSTTA